MKKAFLFTLTLFATGLLHGQEKFEIGLVAGGGYFITGDMENEFDFTNTLSAHGGVYFLKPVFNRQFVETGLLFNYRKTEIDETYLREDMSLIGVSLNSLELPVNYGLKLNNNWMVKAGLSGAWLLAENIERKKFEFNGQLGVGYDLNRVKIFLNYQQGINKTDFMLKDGDRGLFIKHRRSLLKLDINVPIFRF
ncbi:MAG: outer membrane beta-barrel protein [Bacteroidota bacterium]